MSKHTIKRSFAAIAALIVLISPSKGFCRDHAKSAEFSKQDSSEVRLVLPEVTVGALKDIPVKKVSRSVQKLKFNNGNEISGASIEKIFERQPSVFISSGGNKGALATVSLDGGTSSQTLFMIDGRPVNSPSLGTFNIGIIDAGAFSGAEILRGPASATNGPFGLSGAINFEQGGWYSEKPVPELEIITTRTSLHEFSRSVSYIGDDSGRANYRLFFKKENSRGTRSNSDLTGDHAAFSDRLKLNENLSLYLSVYYASTENGVPGVKPSKPGINRYSDADSSSLYDRQSDTLALCNADLTCKLSDRSKFSVKRFRDVTHNYFRSYYDDFITNNAAMFSGDYKTVSTGTFTHYSLSSEKNFFNAGAARIENRLLAVNSTYDLAASKGSSVFYSPSSSVNSIWISGGSELSKDLSVNANLNRDYPDSFGSASSYGLGLKKTAGKNSWFTLFQGKGYRAPTLNEQYYPGSGNAALYPETSIYRNLEYSKMMNDKTRFFANLFTKKTDRMIEWFPDPNDASGFTWIPQNINSFKASGASAGIEKRFNGGVEASLYIQAARYRQVNIEETYNDFMTGVKKTEAIEREARQMPSRKTVFSLKTPAFGTGGEVRLNAVRMSRMAFYYPDYSAAPAVKMREKTIDANTVCDLQMSKKIDGSTKLILTVNNALNEKYARVFGGSYDDGNFPAAGRSFSMTLMSRF